MTAPTTEHPPRAPYRVLVALDEPMARQGIALCAREQLGARGVIPVSTGDGALAALGRRDVDLLVAGMALPDCSGLEVVAGARSRGLAVPTVLTAPTFTREQVLDALQAGVMGLVTARAPHDSWVLAMRAVLAGEPYLDPEIAFGPGYRL